VHWYAHMRECSTVSDFDGRAVHENVLDELRGLDFALSQRHRAALFCGDPQIVEIGVEPGYNPTASISGRSAGVPSSAYGGKPSNANPSTGSYRAPPTRSARVKSPGVAWQYEAKKADCDVKYLKIGSDDLKALDEHAADLRNKIAEALAVVIMDAQNVKFHAAMSGKAIEQFRAFQFDRCDQIRDDVAANWIIPAAQLALRVCLKTVTRGLIAVDKVRGLLEKFAADDAAAPMLFCKWPAGYMKPDPQEELYVVQAAVAARTAKAITKRMALNKLGPIYGVDNVDQALDELEQESADDAKKMQDAMGALHGPPGSPGGPPPKVNGSANSGKQDPKRAAAGAAE
jgi:hypothetical protein